MTVSEAPTQELDLPTDTAKPRGSRVRAAASGALHTVTKSQNKALKVTKVAAVGLCILAPPMVLVVAPIWIGGKVLGPVVRSAWEGIGKSLRQQQAQRSERKLARDAQRVASLQELAENLNSAKSPDVEAEMRADRQAAVWFETSRNSPEPVFNIPPTVAAKTFLVGDRELSAAQHEAYRDAELIFSAFGAHIEHGDGVTTVTPHSDARLLTQMCVDQAIRDQVAYLKPEHRGLIETHLNELRSEYVALAEQSYTEQLSQQVQPKIEELAATLRAAGLSDHIVVGNVASLDGVGR